MDVSLPDHNMQQQTFKVSMRWLQGDLQVNQRFEAGSCVYRQRGNKRVQQAHSTPVDPALHLRSEALLNEMQRAIDMLSDAQGVLSLTGLIRQHRINGQVGQAYTGFWGALEMTGKPTTHFGATLGERLQFRRGPWEDWPSVLPLLDAPDSSLPLVFSPYCGAALHEALGHALEADYLQASPLKHKLGDRLTQVPLTVEDDPNLVGAAGSLAIDDAGLKATATTLLHRGILVGDLGHANGVLRRDRYRDSLQQRASNFIIRSGQGEPSNWLAQKDLLYIAWIQSGNWVPGTQRIKLLTGPVYRVRGGSPTAFAPWSQLSFSTLGLLQRIDDIGNDGKRDPVVHFCVKGHQRVPMALVSPSLLLRGVS